MKPIRILLAEDQAMIREALAALLSFEDDLVVVAQVGRGDEVVKAARVKGAGSAYRSAGSEHRTGPKQRHGKQRSCCKSWRGSGNERETSCTKNGADLHGGHAAVAL